MFSHDNDMTLAEVESETMRNKIDDFRDSLLSDNYRLGVEIDRMGYDSSERVAYLSEIIYRASNFIDHIVRGDPIEKIPPCLGLEAFREFLRVKDSIVDEIDNILDAAVHEEFSDDE